MKKATKKPVEIEFFTFKDIYDFWNEDHRENAHFGWKPYIGERLNETGNGFNISLNKEKDYFEIKTLEGDNQRFTREDVLIIGVRGEIYPCKIDIFKETYDFEGEIK